MQSMRASVVEEATKRAVTFLAAMSLNFLILPAFGFRMPTWSESFFITSIFVGTSFVISLLIRRVFNVWTDT